MEFPDGIAYINISPDDTKFMRFEVTVAYTTLRKWDSKNNNTSSKFTVKGEVTYE